MRLGGPCKRCVRSRASPPSQAIGLTGMLASTTARQIEIAASDMVTGCAPYRAVASSQARPLKQFAIPLYPSSMAKWMVGATGVAVIAATVVAVVLIERGTSALTPPATTGTPTGDDPATGQATGPITDQTPPRSVREGGAEKPRVQEADAVTGRRNEDDAPPAPSDAAQEETPMPAGSLPPELEDLRGEPALEY
jgi:hypothetical protein